MPETGCFCGNGRMGGPLAATPRAGRCRNRHGAVHHGCPRTGRRGRQGRRTAETGPGCRPGNGGGRMCRLSRGGWQQHHLRQPQTGRAARRVHPQAVAGLHAARRRQAGQARQRRDGRLRLLTGAAGHRQRVGLLRRAEAYRAGRSLQCRIGGTGPEHLPGWYCCQGGSCLCRLSRSGR